MKASGAGSEIVALVAGGTRGAGRGIAIELGAIGATVYVTGRTTRGQRSEYGRPETIEETAELVTAAGGTGVASIWSSGIRRYGSTTWTKDCGCCGSPSTRISSPRITRSRC